MSPDRDSPPLPLSLRRPRAAIALTLLLLALLAALGSDIEDRLSPTSLTIAGTPSQRAERLALAHFGPSSGFIVLLRGPAAAIASQGPPLARTLARRGATVLAPWQPGAPPALRPAPRRALLLISYPASTSLAMRELAPRLEATLAAAVHPPLHATQSGYASISRALQRESLAASERAELLAAPLLLVVLLLVFRSLIAALLPLAFGALTVLAGHGVLALLTRLIQIDALSLVVCTMIGLALGVDYSLLIVSRFREELAAGRPPLRAAAITRASAGRTVLLAAATLFAAMLAAAFLQPGVLFAGLTVAFLAVIAISVLVAHIALPALLAILGPRIDALAIAPTTARRPRLAALAAGLLRRPGLAALAIALPLLALAAPALAFNTGAPGFAELSASSPARRSAEAIDRAVGPGWEAPFSITAASSREPVTSATHLAAIAALERRLSADPAVRAVLGPAPLRLASARLDRLSERLGSPAARSRQLRRLARGLRRAGLGLGRLRHGLGGAASGGDLLALGAGRAAGGAALISTALGTALKRSRRAAAALRHLGAGASRLDAALHRAGAGALGLSLGLRSLVPSLSAGELAHSRRLAAELEAASRSQPSLAPAARRARRVAAMLAATRAELRRLHSTAARLSSGLTHLGTATGRLRSAGGALASAAARAPTALARLRGGSQRLRGALARLRGGAAALGSGLDAAGRRSAPLQNGLSRAALRFSNLTAPVLSAARKLRAASPRMLQSGYLVLSALDGAPPAARRLASQAVNIEHGGDAARLLVVPDQPLNSPGSERVGDRIAAAAALARRSGLRVAVGGGAAIINDYARATRARLPLVIGAIILVSFALLLAILRAPLLAALTVLLNLLSVAAAIGAVSLVCKLPAGYPLGGHPYVDSVGAAAIFGVTFGLSIDYAVFLLARIREKYDELAPVRSTPPTSVPSLVGPKEAAFEQHQLSKVHEAATSPDAGARAEDHRLSPVRPSGSGGDVAVDSATEDTAQRPASPSEQASQSDSFAQRASGEATHGVSRNQAAIAHGLNRTAGVITGAAVIMIAVFISFAAAPIATVSQIGFGLTVAIALDATVVRIVLLPALMLLLGERVWHVPPWLGRSLPRIDLYAAGATR